MDDLNRITYFAETDARNKRVPFGIKAKDRSRHVYVIGKTGMGKSTLLENMVIQDIRNGEGVAFIDPHGKTADLLLEYVPEERVRDVLYFAPFDLEHPIAFNVMEDVGPDKRHLVANGLMAAFKKLWADAWSARMEYILNNTILALLEYPGSTLLSINRMYSDKKFRTKVVENISDPSVRAFWETEFASYNDRYAVEATAAIQNKIGQFASSPLVRNIIGQTKSSFNLRKIMDEKKILIINLSKGLVGEDNANLLGSMLITKIYLAAMSRADLSEREIEKQPSFYFFVDEFQSFANESFANILSESRKYKLALTMAHQYIEQMQEEVKNAVFGNVGTMIVFRVGAFDAAVLEKEFAPQFTPEDIVNLGFAQIYLKLMIDGVTSQPFSAITLPPLARPETSLRERVIAASRMTFSRPRAEVEKEIQEWHIEGAATHEDTSKKESGKSKGHMPGDKREIRPHSHGDTPAKKESDTKHESSQPKKPNPFANLKVDSEGHIHVASHKEETQRQEDHEDKSGKRKQKRGPTPEQLSKLREALHAVSSHTEERHDDEGGREVKDEKPHEKKENKPKYREISEQKLRDILKVE